SSSTTATPAASASQSAASMPSRAGSRTPRACSRAAPARTAARRACRARSAATSTRCSTRTARERCCGEWWRRARPPSPVERPPSRAKVGHGKPQGARWHARARRRFAGGYVARLLGKRGATIVSPENFMLYTPMLPEAASGTLEPRHVVVPLRQMCPHAELLLGRATEVDVDGRIVVVETEDETLTVSYDELVVALGAISRALPIPGLAEHALGFKSLADAIRLRNHVLRRLEAADSATSEEQRDRELTFLFIGAGYAGVEALAELSDLVRDAMRYYPGLREAPQHWVLVDAAAKILPEIPIPLGDYAARELAARGVDIRVTTTLESVEAHAATLSDGSRLPTSTVVWTAGVRANPVNERLGLPLDDRGRVMVDPTLRIEGVAHAWGLGDGARVPNEATPGQFDPPTCQHALRQARR